MLWLTSQGEPWYVFFKSWLTRVYVAEFVRAWCSNLPRQQYSEVCVYMCACDSLLGQQYSEVCVCVCVCVIAYQDSSTVKTNAVMTTAPITTTAYIQL